LFKGKTNDVISMTIQHYTQNSWWQRISRFLTPLRLSYAWIMGGGLWLAWLISILLGSGNFDLAKQVIGTDYIQFYVSGLTLREGEAGHLYDFPYQSQLEQEIAGSELTTFHAFVTPPFLAWLFIPFSTLPYLWSFALWSGLALIMMWLATKALGARDPWRKFLWALCWFPVFASISFGQNSLLSLFILCLTYYFWSRGNNFSAGLIASLILFKPQLAIGIGILWLMGWRRDWKALAGLGVGGVILIGMTFLFLPSASVSYLILVKDFLPNIIYGDQFPLYHLHALRGFWILLFPEKIWLAEGLSLIVSVLGILGFVSFYKNNRSEPALLYAGAICLTILITPHAMIYDWALLIIPAILAWQVIPKLKHYWMAVFCVIWLVTLLSGPLTLVQLKVLPIAVQISVPVYILLLISSYRMLREKSLSDEIVKNSRPKQPICQLPK
jgi:alpha-1,2-mannosyltransferase